MFSTNRESNRNVLLIGAPTMVALMIVLGVVAGRVLGPLAAVLTVCCVYWVCCWTLCCFGADLLQLARSYRTPLSRNPIDLLMTWLPPIGVVSVAAFSPWANPSVSVVAAIVGIAVLNGVTEEAFWRGAFVSAFPRSIFWGFAYPTLLFTAWHLALLCIPNVKYEAGALGMLGGAAVMGVLWGGAFWRTHDLRSVTMAHVVTNMAAFYMLARENWF